MHPTRSTCAHVVHLLLLHYLTLLLPPFHQRAPVAEASQPTPCDSAHPNALYGNVYALAPNGSLCLLTNGTFHNPSGASTAYCPVFNQSASTAALVLAKCVLPYVFGLQLHIGF